MEHFLIDRDSRIDPVDGGNTPRVQPGKTHSFIVYCRRNVPQYGFAERLTSFLSAVPRSHYPIGLAATKSCRHRQHFLPDVAHANRGKRTFTGQPISDLALPFRMIGNDHSRPPSGYDALSRCLSPGIAWAFPGPAPLPFPSLPGVKILFANPHILPVAGPATTARLQAAFRIPRRPQRIHLHCDGHPAPLLPRMAIPSSGKYALRPFSALSCFYSNSKHDNTLYIPPLWNHLKVPVPSKLSKVSEGTTRIGALPVA